MKILETKVMRGPNYWSTYRRQLIVMKLDLEEAEDFPTNMIDGFAERIEALLPSMYEHRCSERNVGGFFHRVRRGTWLGHVIEHVALELQSLAGMPCGYGRTRSAGKRGVYHVVFAYELENAGLYAAKAAVNLVQALRSGTPYDLQKDINELKAIQQREGLGPSTLSIVNAAKERNIPVRRLNDRSLVMLGQGVHQKILQATTVSTTSSIALDLASDKNATKKILSGGHIPVPRGVSVYTKDDLKEAISSLGFPLVVKPVNGNHGRAVTTNIITAEEADIALEQAQQISREVIVEKYIPGMDFRFLVINFKLEAVARRTPAMIEGNGISTIAQLIEEANNDPLRGDDHEKVLTRIKIDEQTKAILSAKALTLDSVISQGEILFLKHTANLSTGGTARDVTDIVHPANIFLAERIARLMNLNICGIDIIAEDITQPINIKNGAVIEVNAGPGFRMHLSPAKGTPRNVSEPVVNMLYPEGAPSRIPIVAVTGTNGKTTTTRLIAQFAKNAGHTVGFTTTDGIYIQDQPLHLGDCSGPSSAETILRDPAVDFAVLECARGGILRAGLGFDKCNISIVTNITEDHLGLNGINTLRELAKVKSIVPRSTFNDGYAILNADDDLVYRMKRDLDCNIALFSTSDNNERIKEHCEKGGLAAIIEKGYFTICKGEWRTRVMKVNEAPLTLEGKASSMIKNILPSILAATISNFELKTIRKTLESFIPSPELTPGRMNIFKIRNFEVMVDYVHNTDGFLELKEFMKGVNATTKVGIIGCAGDRRDEDIRQMGRYCGEMFDEIIIRHDKNGRGRTNEELTQLISEGIRYVNPDMRLHIISCEAEALAFAIDHAYRGSFIVLSSDEVRESIAFLQQLQQTELSPSMLENAYNNS